MQFICTDLIQKSAKYTACILWRCLFTTKVDTWNTMQERQTWYRDIYRKQAQLKVRTPNTDVHAQQSGIWLYVVLCISLSQKICCAILLMIRVISTCNLRTILLQPSFVVRLYRHSALFLKLSVTALLPIMTSELFQDIRLHCIYYVCVVCVWS